MTFYNVQYSFELKLCKNIMKKKIIIIGAGSAGTSIIYFINRFGIIDEKLFVIDKTEDISNTSKNIEAILFQSECNDKEEISFTDSITNLFDDVDIAIIAAGINGDTASQILSLLLCQKKKPLLFGVFTIPFLWEGIKSRQKGFNSFYEFQKSVEGFLLIDSEIILPSISDNGNIEDIFNENNSIAIYFIKTLVALLNSDEFNLNNFSSIQNRNMDPQRIVSQSDTFGTSILFAYCLIDEIDSITTSVLKIINSPLINRYRLNKMNYVYFVIFYSTYYSKTLASKIVKEIKQLLSQDTKITEIHISIPETKSKPILTMLGYDNEATWIQRYLDLN